MEYKPEAYQRYAAEYCLARKSAGLFLDMGLGKTAIILTVCEQLLRDSFEVDRVLVIAPKLPALTTWPAELKKWDHLQGLAYSLVMGSQKDRLAALRKPADFYIINREQVVWLAEWYGKRWPFDCVVIDELSSFKSSKAQRFRALRKVRKSIKRLYGLTGTPAPNGLLDLWPQVFLLDGGERLGPTLTCYRDSYFTPGRYGPSGVVYNWNIRPGAEEEIYGKISDLCVSMKTEDHLTLPEKVTVRHAVAIGEKAMAQYKQLSRDMLLPFKDGDVDAATAAILTNKLLQMAGGAVYDEDGKVHEIHDAKLDMLEELVEQACGQPVLLFYNYKHERDRIKARFPQAVEVKEDGAVERWDSGQVPILMANPASAGHGLNLQFGGHIAIWFSPTWNLEYFQQANKRLHRRGQKETVLVHLLIASGTMDERVIDVALAGKEAAQESLLQALHAEIKEVL